MMRFDLSNAENKELMRMITTEVDDEVIDQIECQIMLLAKKLKRANVFQADSKTDEKFDLQVFWQDSRQYFVNIVSTEKDAPIHQLRFFANNLVKLLLEKT